MTSPSLSLSLPLSSSFQKKTKNNFTARGSVPATPGYWARFSGEFAVSLTGPRTRAVKSWFLLWKQAARCPWGARWLKKTKQRKQQKKQNTKHKKKRCSCPGSRSGFGRRGLCSLHPGAVAPPHASGGGRIRALPQRPCARRRKEAGPAASCFLARGGRRSFVFMLMKTNGSRPGFNVAQQH